MDTLILKRKLSRLNEIGGLKESSLLNPGWYVLFDLVGYLGSRITVLGFSISQHYSVDSSLISYGHPGVQLRFPSHPNRTLARYYSNGEVNLKTLVLCSYAYVTIYQIEAELADS
jgi:hypothetical protein